jgi:predicted phosphodiesterase
MRICVLSDVHSNLSALEAVLSALAPYDAVWHLGDIVGYGPQPNEVIARLAREKAVGVRGNHDAAAVGALTTDAFNDEARAAVEWTAD